MSLSGKTALLTGALGTLGRAQARALAAAGANLIMTDLKSAILKSCDNNLNRYITHLKFSFSLIGLKNY